MLKRWLIRSVETCVEIWRTVIRGMRYKQALHARSPFRCTRFMARQLERADD